MKYYIHGCRLVQIETADPMRMLESLQNAGIILWNPEIINEFTVQLAIASAQWQKAESILRHRGEAFRVLRYVGILRTLKRILARPVLLVGLILLLIVSAWLPSRVLFVQVEGNTTVPALLIAEKAAECGIHFGASRREVRSEKMKNALLDAMPQLQWAGVNTYGCIAVISVQERQNGEDPGKSIPGNIVSLYDGVISSMTVTKGTPLVSPGVAVRKGQVLISGYADLGLMLRYEQPEGEIMGLTQHQLQAVMPLAYSGRGAEVRSFKNYALIIGKKRINFKNSSGILDMTCVKIYEKKYMTLPGGFVLPVGWITETWIQYEPTEVMDSEDEQHLDHTMQQYLRQQMIAGQILQYQLYADADPGIFSLRGSYYCQEMIGVLRIEEIE